MPIMASGRWGRIMALFLMAFTACALPMFAAKCDQPVVSFQAGQLAISSTGCSLQQVLTVVSRQIGVSTEVPPSASLVPVFANVGPTDPRQAISALLEGTPFNWSLAIKEEGSPGLERVVLSDQHAMAIPVAPMMASAGASGKFLPGQSPSSARGLSTTAKGAQDAVADLSPQDQQPRRRAEIDDSTLSKLPALPPGVPTGMWALYPGLVANGGTVPEGPATLPNGQPVPATAANTPPAQTPQGPRGCSSCPVPPGVDPRIVTLYPPNLMQMIQMPIQYPPPPPPMAPPIVIH